MLTVEQQERLVALRRDLHMHPELAHQEHRTATVIAERLRALQLDEVRTGVGQTGVVAVLKGSKPGKHLLLRADMDALPLSELDRGQPYRSREEGAHHACGHDGHVAILLTVAEVLVQRSEELVGRVTFVFQPAEERVGGAAGMLAEGALDTSPDAAFGLHLWTELPVGTVDVRPGPIFGSADAFIIELCSSGGHAAMPHQVADPIVASAELIVALQTLVSRESPPLEPAVLTIGSIHGGTAPNIVPTRVELQGTLRVFAPELRERLLLRLEEVLTSVAATFRVQANLRMTDSCPACINDGEMASLVQRAATEVLGGERVSDGQRTMGADDMSLFLNAAPGCYFFVGAANPERGFDSPHHSPTFDFDEAALAVGVQVLVSAALEFLNGG